MSNIVDISVKMPPKGLNNTSGNGTSGGMEARIARLEDDMKEVKSDIKGLRSDVFNLRADVAELKGRVVSLPGYAGIALIVGLMIALSTAAQIGAKFLAP